MKYFWVSIIITGLILISLKLIKLSNYLFSSILVGVASTEVNLLTIILILVPIVLLEEIIFRGVIFEGFLHRYKSWVAFILFYLVVYLIPLGLVKFINIISRSAEVRSFLKRNVDINFLFTHIVTIIVTLTIMWIFYISRDIKLTFFAKLLWELFILFFYRLANGHFFGILEKRDWWLLSGGIILFMLGIYYFYDYSKKGRII
ncbi:hypothetical protein U472_13180 [Orenia metallireducens]|jgi:membrane protease YdiL (CAAX protease family)|uniref:Uncharacterized protein n=1 Tax=Orenia metallireducens TaxID=1413210 RepID=A0A1C0A589_9FIRM|nr:hypothetical protein [Orenia metallireducens]OCL25304.1 hypothetical protein U472_13180 [Orenia metallireducens]